MSSSRYGWSRAHSTNRNSKSGAAARPRYQLHGGRAARPRTWAVATFSTRTDRLRGRVTGALVLAITAAATAALIGAAVWAAGELSETRSSAEAAFRADG